MKNSQKSTSVAAVVPVFNGETHLWQALESILNQTAPVNEIIVVDDGSSDDSLKVITEIRLAYKLSEDFLRVERQSNSGQGAARNRGIQASRSDFIALLDQDDTWTPDHVEILLPHLAESPGTGWVYSDFNELDEFNRVIRRSFLAKKNYTVPHDSIFGFIRQDLMMLPSASLIRAAAFESINGFDSQFRGYEDDDLFVRMLVQGWSFTFEPKPTLNYRIHPNNSSRSLSFQESREKFYLKYRDFFGVESDYRHIFLGQHFGPRMLASSLIDAASAIQNSNDDLLIFSRRFYLEVASFVGISFRHKLIYWLMKRKRTFIGVFRLRARLKSVVQPSKIIY